MLNQVAKLSVFKDREMRHCLLEMQTLEFMYFSDDKQNISTN